MKKKHKNKKIKKNNKKGNIFSKIVKVLLNNVINFIAGIMYLIFEVLKIGFVFMIMFICIYSIFNSTLNFTNNELFENITEYIK